MHVLARPVAPSRSPGFLRAYVETRRRGGRRRVRRRRVAGCRTLTRGPGRSRPPSSIPDGHATNPPARYTEASPDQGARGPRHRPAVDVRVDHQDHPRPRLRLEAGQRAGAVVGGVRGDRSARGALRPAGGLRLHRGDGGRPRRDRRRPRTARTTGCPASTSAASTAPRVRSARSGGLKKMVGDEPRGHRRPRGQLDPAASTTPRAARCTVRVGRFGPYLERMVAEPGRPATAIRSRSGRTCPRTCRRTSSPPEYAEKLFATPQDGRKLGVDPLTGHEIVAKEGRFGPYVTEILPEPEPEPEPDIVAGRDRRAVGHGQDQGRREEGAREEGREEGGRPQAAHRLAVQVDGRWTTVDARGRAAAAVAAARGRRRPESKAKRSPRRTAATGRT